MVNEASGVLAAFAGGAWIGLSIAAPVGPIGLLVIERTLRQGLAVGLATGLGAALADALYGAIGAYGVQALVDVLQAARMPLMWGGSLFLLWLAWRTWRGAGDGAAVAAAAGADAGARVALPAAFAGTVLLTLANPATVLSFVAIFGSQLALAPAASPAWRVAGVACGSALWWLLLATGVAAARHRLGAPERAWISRGAALMLLGFALWALRPAWAGLV